MAACDRLAAILRVFVGCLGKENRSWRVAGQEERADGAQTEQRGERPQPNDVY